MEKEVAEVSESNDSSTIEKESSNESESKDVAKDISNVRAPYASYIHHCNSIKVLPKLTRKPSNTNSNTVTKPSVTIGAQPTISTVSIHGVEKIVESTVPSALGLLRTSALPESPIAKPKIHKIPISKNPAAVALSRDSILDARKRKIVASRPMNAALANKSLNFKTIKIIFGFLKNSRRHKWVTYEWFQSLLDSQFLKSPTHFQRQMEKIVPPGFKVGLNKFEWNYLRTKMRPYRRFSSAFLKEERLEWKRIVVTVRLLQTSEICYIKDRKCMEDIPRSIPKVLSKGCVVQVLVMNPFRGVHRAAVVEHDRQKNGYFVQFLSPLVTGMVKQNVFVKDNQLMSLQELDTVELELLNMQGTPDTVENGYHIRIGESTCINGYALKDILALWALLRLRQRQERQLYRLFDLNNKVMKTVEKEELSQDTQPFAAKILNKYQRILEQLEDLHLGILHNIRIVENCRDELKFRSMNPIVSECSVEQIIDTCCVSCVSYINEYATRPIEPHWRGRIGMYLMVFKLLQTIGCNSQGLTILKLQLRQLYLCLNEECSQLFASAFLPLIERYVKEVESLLLPSKAKALA